MKSIAIRQLCNHSGIVRDFFNPHLLDIGIIYALHLRVFNDGRAFVLGNKPEYIEHYLCSGYSVPEPGTITKNEIDLWCGNIALQTYDNQVDEMRTIFNIDHQVSFFYAEDGYVDIYDLGTISQRPDMLNYYINNREMLENLFLGYKDKFSDLLAKLDNQPLILPIRPKNFDKKSEIFTKFSTISARELQCLHLLSKGHTAKMIANELYISSRTVERHIENIRNKLDVKHKLQIINLYMEYSKFASVGESIVNF